MTAALDTARWHPRGVIEKFDADDIRAYARRGKLGPFSRLGRVVDMRRRGVVGDWVPRDVLVAAGIRPYETVRTEGNLLTTAGVTRLWNLATNQGATQAFDASHTRVGVGNGSTAATAADTDLSAAAGSTNRWFNLVDAASTVSTNTNKWTSTVATGNGNFSWAEWGIDQGTAGGTTVVAPLLNHAVPAGGLGTKTSAAAWAFSVTLSIT